MELTQRQRIIFKVIVERFINMAEPVGSKTLQELLDFQVSSATIRNEMAVLERYGLIEKTHTSSGRIPSAMGYRYYVEHLMETSLDAPIKASLQQIFAGRHFTLEEAVQTSCQILSEMTNLTTVVLGPNASTQKLKHVQLIPLDAKKAVCIIITDSGHTENKIFEFEQDVTTEDLAACTELLNSELIGTPMSDVVAKMEEIKPLMAAKVFRHEILFDAFVNAFMKFATEKVAVSGRSNMLYQPEFSDLERLKKMMKVLENSDLFKAWMEQCSNVATPLGTRDELIQIGDCSVISSRFNLQGDEQGKLMVVGPNRMEYSKIVPLVDYMSKIIESCFGQDEQGGHEHE